MSTHWETSMGWLGSWFHCPPPLTVSCTPFWVHTNTVLGVVGSKISRLIPLAAPFDAEKKVEPSVLLEMPPNRLPANTMLGLVGCTATRQNPWLLLSRKVPVI